jgi:polyhydroxybutyrate depolymerase
MAILQKMKKILLIAAALLLAAALNAQTVRHTMEHNGTEREYWLYVPETLCDARPLVFMCHGYGGKAEGYFPAMIECARRHGFVLCYPQGLPDPGKGKPGWNVGYPSQAGWEQDDVAFILALQEKLQAEFNLNPRNTCFSGMSNGGEMCYLLAYTHPERFAAIVSLAGLTMEWIYRDVKPAGPVPFIEIHGTADKTSRWEGDPDNHDGWGEYVAVPVSVGRMVSINNCTHELCDTLPLYKEGSNIVVRHRYMDGTNGNEVRLYEVIGGKHKNGSADMDVPELIWEFLSLYLK